MIRRLTWGRFASVGCVLVVGLALAGCSSVVSGTAQPDSDSGLIDAASERSAPSSRTSTPIEPSGAPDFPVGIDECVLLGGTGEEPIVVPAPCSSKLANYRVIDLAAHTSECVADADINLTRTRNGVHVGAVCMDANWVVGECVDVGGEVVVRIDCSAPFPEKGIEVTAIRPGFTDVGVCSTGFGKVYDVRRIVVCGREI
ncbi:hypothetical protein [Nocardia sp. CNY236]|uniref:LppU family putative lipoprotein n=1 Tax=Nocardia sp. CNY236 TaxID=1169152 RepID=UPI00041C511E|nr:hypothetical protein [Nocardia sp. CNY236]